MNEFVLKRSQKNQLFNLIKDADLSPYNFELKEFRDPLGNTITKIEHRDSEFYFKLSLIQSGYYIIFSPSTTRLIESEQCESWSNLYFNFIDWINSLKKEITEPDLWEDIKNYQLPDEIKSINADENSRFNYSEVMQIKEGIAELKEYFKENFTLEKEQHEAIDRKLDCLIESSEKQGRRDFIFMVIGNIITIISPLVVTKENVEFVWGTVKSMFLGLVDALPK